MVELAVGAHEAESGPDGEPFLPLPTARPVASASSLDRAALRRARAVLVHDRPVDSRLDDDIRLVTLSANSPIARLRET